jgi:hypothetical protein
MVPLGHMSTDKLNEIGLQYQQPVEEAINDTVTSLKEHGWLAWGFGWSIGFMLIQPIIANFMKFFYVL